MTSLKNLVKDFIPPAIFRIVRNFIRVGIRFEGSYPSWQAASDVCAGYDAKQILEKVLEATLKVKRGEAAYERDSVLFSEIVYDWPILASLMSVAARSRGKLHVLDLGGALGSAYFQNRSFLVDLPQISWSVVEQSHYVQAGITYISDGILRFYDSIDRCLLERKPNVIILSSVLQYLPEPFLVIEELLKVKAEVIVIDKTIVNKSEKCFVHVQKVPKSIYKSSYPCRSLSEKMLLKSFERDYCLQASFDSLEFPALHAINSQFKGYVFRRR